MTLKDLYDWIWFGEGYYILHGFLQAWDLMDNHQQQQSAIPQVAAPPDDGQGPWHGGACYPLGDFEDEHDLLADLGISRP